MTAFLKIVRHVGMVSETLLCLSGGKDGGKEEKELPSLDRFLSKNTSEDNASFEQIMALAQDKEKLKNAWLYEAESEFKQVPKHCLSIHVYMCVCVCLRMCYLGEHCFINTSHYCVLQRREENLALPSSETQALECVKAGVETWEYTAKNALMYYPEGKKYSQHTLICSFNSNPTLYLTHIMCSEASIKERGVF